MLKQARYSDDCKKYDLGEIMTSSCFKHRAYREI